LIVLVDVGALQAAVTPLGADGTVCERDSAELAVCNVTIQFVAAHAAPVLDTRRRPTRAIGAATRRVPPLPFTRPLLVARSVRSRSAQEKKMDQLVQLSVAGVVVEVAAPPVAVTPVKEGMEKYVLAQAAGVVVPMLASLVSVTAKGLLDWPLAPTVSGVVSVCEVPDVAVEKFHVT
jgi:hypothetical protein